ncbi:MAG: hypothetical protein WC238_02695 [Parcubacteria group bacterium]|jgi:hypothetical protein
MIDIPASLKESVVAAATELIASDSEDLLKLPNDEIFISLKRNHEDYLCFADIDVQGKKVYILHKK